MIKIAKKVDCDGFHELLVSSHSSKFVVVNERLCTQAPSTVF